MFFYIILFIAISLDLLTKYIAELYLDNKINIFGDFLYLEFVKNPGIAFGVNVPFLKIITICLIIFIFSYYIKEKDILNKKKSHLISRKTEGLLFDLAFALILAGAIGNGIERVLYSEVIDFVGVKYFAIFNLADSFISIGAIIYIYLIFKNK